MIYLGGTSTGRLGSGSCLVWPLRHAMPPRTPPRPAHRCRCFWRPTGWSMLHLALVVGRAIRTLVPSPARSPCFQVILIHHPCYVCETPLRSGLVRAGDACSVLTLSWTLSFFFSSSSFDNLLSVLARYNMATRQCHRNTGYDQGRFW